MYLFGTSLKSVFWFKISSKYYVSVLDLPISIDREQMIRALDFQTDFHIMYENMNTFCFGTSILFFSLQITGQFFSQSITCILWVDMQRNDQMFIKKIYMNGKYIHL